MGIFGDIWDGVKSVTGDVKDAITHPQDALGLTNNATVTAPTLDPNAFNYGGSAGGATAASGRLQSQGASANSSLTATGSNNNFIDQSNANAARGQTAPGTNYNNANADRTVGGDARNAQNTALGYLNAQANGTGPSAADTLLQKANDDAIRNQSVLAAGARGPAALAGAQANAAGNVASLNQQNASTYAAQRAQEQAQAQQTYAGATTAARAGDLSQQAQDAQQAQYIASLQEAQNNLNNSTALGYTSLGQNNALGYAGLGAQTQTADETLANQVNIAQLQAQGDQQKLAGQESIQSQEDNAGIQGQNRQQAANLISGGAGAIGGLASAALGFLSDENLKSEVEPAGVAPGGYDFKDDLQTPEGGLSTMVRPVGVRDPNAPSAPGVQIAPNNGKGFGGGAIGAPVFSPVIPSPSSLPIVGNFLGSPSSAGSMQPRGGLGGLLGPAAPLAGPLGHLGASVGMAGSGGASGMGPATISSGITMKTGIAPAGGPGVPDVITSDKEAKHEAFEAGKRSALHELVTATGRVNRAQDDAASSVKAEPSIVSVPNPSGYQPEEMAAMQDRMIPDRYNYQSRAPLPSGGSVESYAPVGGREYIQAAPGPIGSASARTSPAPVPTASPSAPATVGQRLGALINSDEDEKEGARERHTEADRFLDHLRPFSYRYKDPRDAPTSRPSDDRFLGVMAQDVERGPTGDTIVKDTPKGKVLEGGAFVSALAAGVGRLNERLAELEDERKRK